MRVALPEERVRGEIENRLHSLMRTTRVPGFRPGKVPLKIIENRYGKTLRQEVIGKMIRTSLYEALQQENLKPANAPQIDQIEDKQGHDLSYTASFEVYPEIELAPMNKLEIEKPMVDIGPEDVSNMVEILRKKHARFNKVDRAAAVGDVLNINFSGTIEGKEPGETGAENYDLELGAGLFIEEFERGLQGKSANEELRLAFKFPDDYNDQNLKGKNAEFNIHINEVKEAVVPDLDDALFEKYGVKQGGMDAFEAEIRNNMQREAEMMIRKKLKEAVLNALLDANQIELPGSLIHGEERKLQEEIRQAMGQKGTDPATMQQTDDKLSAVAHRRVALQLILSDIINKNKLKTEPARVRKIIQQIASGYENPDAIVNWYYSDQKKLAEIEALSLEEDAVDWVAEQAAITEKAYTFDELMKKRQTIPTAS